MGQTTSTKQNQEKRKEKEKEKRKGGGSGERQNLKIIQNFFHRYPDPLKRSGGTAISFQPVMIGHLF